MGWHRLGRYRGGDEGAPPGTSIAEANIFAILNFVLGGGKRGYKVGGYYGLRTDMGFHLNFPYGHTLIVEYDAEYWHREREETDTRKICRVLNHDHDIIRIREQPLRRLHPSDISVPQRADALTCARLTLLHLAHRASPFDIDPQTLARIEQFLSVGMTMLTDDQIVCGICQELNYVLDKEGPFGEMIGDRKFTQLAHDLAFRPTRYESIWHPDDRSWEQREAKFIERRGFTSWLADHRAAEPSESDNPGSTDASSGSGSTIPLFPINLK